MKDTIPTSNPSERFRALYDTVSAAQQPFVVADAKAGAPVDVSLATAENLGPDNLRCLGYKALSLLFLSQIRDKYVVAKVRETIELYEGPEGELTACFGDSVKIMTTSVGVGTNYGHPHREYAIPSHSAEIATNSALLAMEQALGQTV